MRGLRGRRCVAVGCLSLFVAAAANAQPATRNPQEPRPEIAITPAIWINGFGGTMSDADGQIHVDEGLTGVADSGNLGLATRIDFSSGRVSASGDFLFARPSNVEPIRSAATTAPAQSASNQLMTLDALIGFRTVDRPQFSLDLLVGLRIVRMYPTWQLGPLPGGALTASDWGDSVGGARVGVRTSKLMVNVKGDIGGRIEDALGRSSSWNLDGEVGWRLSKGVYAIGGYRALHVNRESNALVIDLTHHGLVGGIRLEGEIGR